MRIRGPMSVVNTQKPGEQLGNIHRFILHTDDLLEFLSYAFAPLHYFNIPDAFVKHSLTAEAPCSHAGLQSNLDLDSGGIPAVESPWRCVVGVLL